MKHDILRRAGPAPAQASPTAEPRNTSAALRSPGSLVEEDRLFKHGPEAGQVSALSMKLQASVYGDFDDSAILWLRDRAEGREPLCSQRVNSGYGDLVTAAHASRLRPSPPVAWQGKLEIGAVDDPLERDADRIADQIVMSSNSALGKARSEMGLSGTCARCESTERSQPASPNGSPMTKCSACEKRDLLQRALKGGSGPSEAPDNLIARLGSGRALDDSTRSFMETSFERDFSGIRIHEGSAADNAAQSVQALAFTAGRDIVFRDGAYSPTSLEGRRLLAHELAHTVQQGAAGLSLGGLSPQSIASDAKPGEQGPLATTQRPAATGVKAIQLKQGDECGTDFIFAFQGEINAEPEKQHRGVPRAYYSRVPGKGNDTGDIVKGSDRRPLPLIAGTKLEVGQLHKNKLWRAVCVTVPGVKDAQILWVLNEYIDNTEAKTTGDEKGREKKVKPKTDTRAASGRALLSAGVTVELDMSGGLTSKEVVVGLKSNDSTTIELTFRHTKGTKSCTVKLIPKRIKVKGAYFHAAGTTDGVHPLELYVVGTSAEEEKKAIFHTIFVAPGGAPGKYAVMEGEEYDAKSVQMVDLGVPDSFSDVGEKILEPTGQPVKAGGTWQIRYQVGPKKEFGAALYLIKDPDDENGVLCYFAMSSAKAGIQTAPSRSMKMPLPVKFEDMRILEHSASNNSVTYCFLQIQNAEEYWVSDDPCARGFLVTYEMNPIDPAKVDPSNALHGLNVYPVDTGTGKPDSIVPTAKARFTHADESWKIGSEKRTVESFRIESAKDALSKLPTMTVSDNESVSLMNEMSLLAMTAVKEGIASKALFEQWVELSFGVTVYGPDAAKGDETAKIWLKEKSDLFLKTLLEEIGTRGTKRDTSIVGDEVGALHTNKSENKYTGASRVETQWVGGILPTEKSVTERGAFEDVRNLFGAGNYNEAIAILRAAYYLWVEDQLLENTSTDKDTKDKLKSYGHQMSYRRQLKETMAGQTKPLKKVRALYYPDMTNITGQNPYERKYVAVDKIVSIPLDIYYQDTGTDWVLYNYTTLTEPGKLNGFKRTQSKASDESVPPQEMFDLLTKDEGVGTGYIHYETSMGGGIVRVDHPWTLGGILLGAAVVIGLIALALTGIGALFEGAAIGGVSVAGAATVLGDVAMITALAGGTIKLATDIAEGAPITAGQVAGLALDVATAVVPVIRTLHTVSSLKRWKNMFVLLDTAAEARWATKLELAANTTAIVVGTGAGIEEMITLSKALEEGKIDQAAFYWAVVRNVGLGVINVVLLRSGLKSLEGRTIGNTTIDEVVQKSLAKNLLETSPDAMYTPKMLEAGIEIMQNSSSVHRSMVLEALSNESTLEKAVDVLCYLGAKGRGSIEDVVILDGKVRRAIDVLVEGKFFGKTLPIPQGFSGSKGEALDDISRDFAAFSKTVAQGVHEVPGLGNAEVRMQGSATMGITKPKKPAEVSKSAKEPAVTEPAWDVDLAVMLEPDAYRQKLVSIFKDRVGYTNKKLPNKGKIDLESMTPERLIEEAKKMNAEDVARKTARREAEAKGEEFKESGEKVYNSEAYTFANALLTGKANMAERYFPELVELRTRLINEFKLPKIDLSVIAKNSGFDSTPFIVLE